MVDTHQRKEMEIEIETEDIENRDQNVPNYQNSVVGENYCGNNYYRTNGCVIYSLNSSFFNKSRYYETKGHDSYSYDYNYKYSDAPSASLPSADGPLNFSLSPKTYLMNM